MIKYPYSRPTINKSDIKEVNSVLKKGYLTQGEKLEKFEINIKKIFKSKHAVVCNSGTAALHLVYNALGLGPKKGLLTSPITFLATANAARMCNAPVYFADTDPKTGLLTPETIESALINSNFEIKIITLVHLGGKVCDLEGIARVAKKYNCYLVEDACHAPGPLYFNNGKRNIIQNNCKYSIASTYSFHAIKHIAMGEGGCITTNDESIAKIIKEKRSHGIKRIKTEMEFLPEKNAKWYYEMHDLGWNYRADELTCALGLSQLKRLKTNINKRKKLADCYYSYLVDNKYITLPLKSYHHYLNLWHLFTIQIDFERLEKSRGEVMHELEKMGIGTQVHYIPLFLQPYYRRKNLKILPGAMEYYKNTLSIPLYTALNNKDIIYISSKINKVIN